MKEIAWKMDPQSRKSSPDSWRGTANEKSVTLCHADPGSLWVWRQHVTLKTRLGRGAGNSLPGNGFIVRRIDGSGIHFPSLSIRGSAFLYLLQEQVPSFSGETEPNFSG